MGLLQRLAKREISYPAVEETGFGNALQGWAKVNHDRLNERQQQALLTMLLRPGIVPISAPFGCGKTELVATAVTAYVLAHPDRRVVVFAETNEAVDTDMVRTVNVYDGWKADDLLRIGDNNVIVHKYPRYSYTAKMKAYKERWTEDHPNHTKSDLSKALKEKRERLMKTAKIIFSTSSSLGILDLRNVDFHLCINDEAGQSPDASAIMGLRKKTVTLVLIGDQRQLPPYRCDPKTQQNEAYFEGFYPFKIATGKAFREPGWLKGMSMAPNVAIGDQRVLLANLNNAKEENETNVAEAQWIGDTLRSIADRKKQTCPGAKKWSVFVITPYRAQLKLLTGRSKGSINGWWRELCVEYLTDEELEIRCLTADSCQGKEANISLISLVRTERVGFLNVPNRVLMMLSRASDYLMIAAHRSTFASDYLWGTLFKRMKLCEALMYDDARTASA
ncbi:hypothetical protein JG688_00007795 [Phytophthora aleatoria]|uniref:DNA2/NAM7 helicase-like C-terminal domain-containing protein n=1 Tax=Phytophthora aleatoria TaxID=2496075 RepID=A0A8J5J7J7_9STRA|nr:hypothetical protein JG688_00007795 [Phytophthora aleatoria]